MTARLGLSLIIKPSDGSEEDAPPHPLRVDREDATTCFFASHTHIFSVHGLADNGVFIFSRALRLTGDPSARALLSIPSLRAGCDSIPT